jgi:glycosyltransferase involved in cell wall biosynthesis
MWLLERFLQNVRPNKVKLFNSMAKRILILNPGHLSCGPRLQKEAAAAKLAGFEVMIRGVWWDDRYAHEDLELSETIGVDFAPVLDIRLGKRWRNYIRLRRRFAKEAFIRFNAFSPNLYGYGARELLAEAIHLKADLTLVHSEVGLWVGLQLLRHGFKVGVDFDDWFSADLPLQDRTGRPVKMIQSLERTLLREASLTTTTTDCMANAMAQDAQSSRIPIVIPNCFPWAKAPVRDGIARDAQAPGIISFYWFSQTIGSGRGLETLAQALKILKGEWQLHLRGELRKNNAWFEAVFPEPIRSRTHIHPVVANKDLALHTVGHDIGLALEVPYCSSRNLTATNKIFEYLRCGLAVVATSTAGQLEVMERCPDAGWIVPPSDVHALAEALQHCIDNPEAVSAAKAKALLAAEHTWYWESFEVRLQKAYHTVIG